LLWDAVRTGSTSLSVTLRQTKKNDGFAAEYSIRR